MGEAMKDYRDLLVWQKAHAVVLDIYRLTADFPVSERYGLTSQLRRCATSVPSNIAEGCGRGSDADFGRFVQIAMGSASELEYQLLLAHDLEYVVKHDHLAMNERVQEVKRMLSGLFKTLYADR